MTRTALFGAAALALVACAGSAAHADYGGGGGGGGNGGGDYGGSFTDDAVKNPRLIEPYAQYQYRAYYPNQGYDDRRRAAYGPRVGTGVRPYPWGGYPGN